MPGLHSQLPVHAEYLVHSPGMEEIAEFMGLETVEFMKGRLTYGSIHDLMKRVYIEYFATWAMLKLGYI